MIPAAVAKLLASKAITGAQLAQVGKVVKDMIPPQTLAKLGLGSKTGLLATLVPGAALFAGGAIVGMTVGWLTAPRTGSEMRDELKRKLASLRGASESADPSASESDSASNGVDSEAPGETVDVQDSAASWLRNKAPAS